MTFSLSSYLFPLLLLAGVMFIVSFKQSRFVINPASLLVVIWISVIALHGLFSYFQPIPLYSAGLTANFLAACGVATFALAFSLSSSLFSRRRQTGTNRGGTVTKKLTNNLHRADGHLWIDWLIVIYSVGVLILMYQTASGIVGSGDVFSQLQLLRYRTNYDNADWGGVVYASLSVTVAAIYIGSNNAGLGLKKNIPVFIVFIIAVIISIISSQRTSLLFLIIGFFFARSRNGFPSLRVVLGALLFFIGMFIFVGVVVGKAGSAHENVIYNVFEGINAFLLYLLTPLSAFDYSGVWNAPEGSGGLTTRFIFKFLQAIGVYNGPVSSLVMDFVDVPISTNVYTFLHAPIWDFGYWFFLYFLLVGFIYGFAFSFGRTTPLEKSIQGMMYYPLVVSIFQDQMFVIFSQWVQVFTVLLILRFIYQRFGRVRFKPARTDSLT